MIYQSVLTHSKIRYDWGDWIYLGAAIGSLLSALVAARTSSHHATIYHYSLCAPKISYARRCTDNNSSKNDSYDNWDPAAWWRSSTLWKFLISIVIIVVIILYWCIDIPIVTVIVVVVVDLIAIAIAWNGVINIWWVVIIWARSWARGRYVIKDAAQVVRYGSGRTQWNSSCHITNYFISRIGLR